MIVEKLKFGEYKDCLLNAKAVLKSQQRFKSERYNLYTEEVNKMALSSNEDKRLQTFDKITTYLYGTSAGKVCKAELLSKVNIKLLILMSILMKLLGSTESKITKDKNGENVSHLEVVELVLVHCNLVNNDDQQDSRILYTFLPNKTFDSFLEISPTNHIFLKALNSEFQEIKIWFADQTSKPLEVEDRINVILIIK